MDLPQIIEHGRSELRFAELVLAGHTTGWHGMCTCLRPEPCAVRAGWDDHATYWRGRLATLEAMSGPTQLLPTIAR